MNEKEVEIKITPEIDLTTYQNQIKQMEKELSNLDKRIAGYYNRATTSAEAQVKKQNYKTPAEQISAKIDFQNEYLSNNKRYNNLLKKRAAQVAELEKLNKIITQMPKITENQVTGDVSQFKTLTQQEEKDLEQYLKFKKEALKKFETEEKKRRVVSKKMANMSEEERKKIRREIYAKVTDKEVADVKLNKYALNSVEKTAQKEASERMEKLKREEAKKAGEKYIRGRNSYENLLNRQKKVQAAKASLPSFDIVQKKALAEEEKKEAARVKEAETKLARRKVNIAKNKRTQKTIERTIQQRKQKPQT